MGGDILAADGLLFLGSRLKRLGERMQADVARIVEAAGLPIQPTHYPVLAAIDRAGPATVGDIARAIGISQPAVTRGVTRLIELGFVATHPTAGDRRQKGLALTEAGNAAMLRSKREVWPHVESAVAELCGVRAGSFLTWIGELEHGLRTTPLDRRAADGATSGLRIRGFDDTLAGAFHDINAAWISAMFTLEPTDREVLENPRERIIAPGGDILFVEADGVGVIGTCALQRTGERRFELTKMGVTENARGRKAGEFLLRAVLRRARELDAELLYLLTNSKCAPAIHLYGKLGFVHDAAIGRDYGARYARCDVAMRFARHDTNCDNGENGSH